MSFFLLILLSPLFLVLAVLIKLDSPGKVFFCQERVTQYGRIFKIYKFRTMVQNNVEGESEITVYDDIRITKLGKKIRAIRLDELPQLFNILKGDMSFVGVRPEVPYYVQKYTSEMLSTLLLPAGVTSLASLYYQEEEICFIGCVYKSDIDKIYVQQILPSKMTYNLYEIANISILREFMIMIRTIGVLFR